MNHYRQSIILFGFALPLLLVGLVVGAFAFARAKILTSFEDKRSHFSSYERERQTCLGLESQIGLKRPHVNRWTSLLREETASSLTSQLKQVSAGLSSREFIRTAFDRPNTRGSFGAASLQKSSPVQLSFRASFRSMQRVFVGLESRMPQLQLDELRIDRTGNTGTLNFQVAYTVWEN